MFDDEINEIYKLYKEVHQSDIDLINSDRSSNELPLGKLFGSKIRVVFGIENEDETFSAILDSFKESNVFKFDRFDYDKKKAIITIETQRGPKSREESLASLVNKQLQAGEIELRDRNDWIKWIEQNTVNLGKSDKSLVFSRSPIDNLRMSDISSIKSCHSPSGSYYNCALSEAKEGGIIVYVVSNEELGKMDQNDIENKKEIFIDKDRDINGINALARVRLRKFKDNADDIIFFLPENKIYIGSHRTSATAKFPSILETINGILQKVQDLNKADILYNYKNNDIEILGGTYQDSSPNELFNDYFKTEDFKYKDLSNGSESIDLADQLETELAEFNRLQTPPAFCSYNVEGDDEYVYYTAHGGIEIDLSAFDLHEDAFNEIDVQDEDDLEHARDNDDGWEIPHELYLALDKLRINVEYIYSWEFYPKPNRLRLVFELKDDNDSSTLTNADDYRYFVNYTINKLSEDYELIKRAIITVLHEHKLVNLTNKQLTGYNLNNSKEEENYDNFSPSLAGNSIKVQFDTGINSTYLYNINKPVSQFSQEVASSIHSNLSNYLNSVEVPDNSDDTSELNLEGVESIDRINKKKINLNSGCVFEYSVEFMVGYGSNPKYVASQNSTNIEVVFFILDAPRYIKKHLNTNIDDVKQLIIAVLASLMFDQNTINKNPKYKTLVQHYIK